MDEFSVKALFASIHKAEVEESCLESYQPTPLQLVRLDENGHLQLCPEGRDMLKQISGRVAVIGIYGPQRTGKSSLMNLLISDSGNGFDLSHDPSSRTEGIWIWGEPIRTKENYIIFLDCEGTKSLSQTSSSDAKIFGLMTLLTSILIYNSKGVIDEDSINQLVLATLFAEVIDFTIGYADSKVEIDERISAEAPKFVWVLRDFHLSITDDNGKPLSAKEYMENILNLPCYMGKNAEKNSKIRESILQIFKERDCYTLPVPLDRIKDLDNFGNYELQSMRSKFQTSFNKFKVSILEGCPNKKFSGSEVSGNQLAIFIQEIITVLNEAETPNLYQVWEHAIRVQYEELLCKAKDKYMENKNIDPALMPFEDIEILEKLQLAKDIGLEIVTSVPHKDLDLELEMCENFQEFFNEDTKMTLKNNFAASEAYNLSLIESVYRPIIEKVDEGYYNGDFENMETDWIKALRQYEKEAKGPGRFAAISEFSRIHQHDAYAKFFQDILDKFKNELDILRIKDKENQERLKRQQDNEARQKIIDEYVRKI